MKEHLKKHLKCDIKTTYLLKAPNRILVNMFTHRVRWCRVYLYKKNQYDEKKINKKCIILWVK